MSECPDEANRDWRSISSLFASGLSDGATPPFHASGDPLRALFQWSGNELTSTGWRWAYGTVRRRCTTGARVTPSVRGGARVALGPGISDCTIGNVRE